MRYVGGILCGVLVLSVAWKVVLLQTSTRCRMATRR